MTTCEVGPAAGAQALAKQQKFSWPESSIAKDLACTTSAAARGRLTGRVQTSAMAGDARYKIQGISL